jgi:hypothetical protein
MAIKLFGTWENTSPTGEVSYTCGYCGTTAGPSKKYYCKSGNVSSGYKTQGNIFICPKCNKPTFFTKDMNEQVPGPILGSEISHLPDSIEQLYNEARKCISVNAFTAAILSCRKLLMNVSVTKGATEGKSFVYYVDFLNDNHYIPPGSKGWVDHIRKKGNEATHEIPSMSKDDAVELLEFTEMLLRFVYEMTGKMEKYNLTK